MEINEVQTNIVPQINKGRSYGLIAGLITLVVVLIASVAFGSYLYINNVNHQKKIDELNKQVDNLKSDLLDVEKVQPTPTYGEEEFAEFNGGKIVKFYVHYPPAFKLVSDDTIENYYETFSLINNTDNTTAIKIETINITPENFGTKTEDQILRILGNRYSKNGCGEIAEKSFKVAGTTRYALQGTKTNTTCTTTSDISATVYALHLKDNFYAVITTSYVNDLTLIDIVAGSMTYLNE